VDCYAPQRAAGVLIAEQTDVEPGFHELEVRVSAEKNEASSGTRVGIDAVEVLLH